MLNQDQELAIRVIVIFGLLISYSNAEDCYTPKWVPGYCVNLRQCESMLQMIVQYNQNGDSSTVTYLQNSICGYNGFDMNVCCPSPRFLTTSVAPLYFFTFAPSPLVVTTFAPIVNGQNNNNNNNNNWNSNNPQTFAPINFTPGPPPVTYTSQQTFPAAVFPTSAPGVIVSNPSNPTSVTTTTLPTFERNQCGMSNATHSRVVGGLPAQANAWPWIALIGYRSAFEARPNFLCGGTLITQRHVLTAAHCIKDSLYMVRLGEHDLTSTSDSVVYDIPVDLNIVHELFDPKIIYSDIALLRLAQSAPFNDKVRPICLPLSDELRNKDYTYYQPFLAGWGATTYRGSQAAVLQEVQLPIQPIKECEEAYKTYFPEQIFDDKVLCVGLGSGGKDSCQGDSGGPLMLPQLDKDSGYYYFNLLGIVSYGYECARPGFPGIYTRVTSFIPWIQQHVND